MVTSALPYVNNLPHLGTLVCIISADVYTRYLKQNKYDVISILGTDEHGTTTELKAREQGITPEELTNKYYKQHKEIYEFFSCNFDCFGRTSDRENHQITQEIFLKLYQNNYIKSKTTNQYYCNNCKIFLADRFIIGTCPNCGYEKARGDQCEICGKLLDPEDLINPKCIFCGEKPELKESQHLFLELDKLENQIIDFVNERKENWSENAVTMTYSWLKEGLKPRCITRDLSFGIKVPLEGYENKVFYSWFDAPIGYIGITKKNRKDWKDYWLNDEEVSLIQFMGKDNIPFHTILFPAYLIGTKENYTLLKKLSVNEYLNYENTKFSKSNNIGVFGDDAISIGIKPDIWRYYLMINRPEKSDTNFSWKDFQEKTNNELIANLGNFVNRVIAFTNRFYNSKIPEIDENNKETQQILQELENKTKEHYEKIKNLLEKIEIKTALKEIMLLSKKGNQIFQESQLWKTIKQNKEKANTYLYYLLNLVKDLAIFLYPYMPNTSNEIMEMLNLKEKEEENKQDNKNKNQEKTQEKTISYENLNKRIEQNKTINKSKPLFKKLEDKEIKELEQKYSGKKPKQETQKQQQEEQQEFSKLNLKVAIVKQVKDIANADKLYSLTIDFGNEQRNIIAGLKKYYTKEELLNKHIIVVTNLEPAKIRGEISNGMLLAGSDENENKVKILQAPNTPAGTQVFIEKSKTKPEQKQITINEFSKIKLIVNNKRAYYKEISEETKLKTNIEEIQVDLDRGTIR